MIRKQKRLTETLKLRDIKPAKKHGNKKAADYQLIKWELQHTWVFWNNGKWKRKQMTGLIITKIDAHSLQ